MLELRNLSKNYYAGNQVVPALKNVNLKFRRNEFVSILGPSGCGKTTMLNIIGGLDKYTSGDLLIDNVSTSKFKATNWDAYRNSTIGFVFQSYNLISHLSVLNNVEMALSLSGVNAKERKDRATKVLNEVGLGDQLSKKPNQLSGGQMQRVAIARALVNDPKILLADEPTGALDSKTSVQIMKLIQEISKDRLVIMVTHNSKTAEEYSDRIINLLDGEIISDTNTVADMDEAPLGSLFDKKVSMSYKQALKTSFKNLITKKGRTIITAIAGSIGIIGIALVLAISTGMTDYIDEVQGDTLAGFPITIDKMSISATPGPPSGGLNQEKDTEFPSENKITLLNESDNYTIHNNNFDESFIAFLEGLDKTHVNSISYTSAVALQIVAESDAGAYNLVEIASGDMNPFLGGSSVFTEMLNNQAFVESQYDVLAGHYPSNYQELALVVNSENQIDLQILNALGFSIEDDYTFEDFIGQSFKVIPNDLFYSKQGLNYLPNTNFGEMYNHPEAIEIKVACIMRVNEDATSEVVKVGLNYTAALTNFVQDNAMHSEIVLAQQASPDTNILTGSPFNEQITYDYVMQVLGGDSTPTGIQIYPASFEAKDYIKKEIDDFNKGKSGDDQIVYTDLAEVISDAISTLINTITIILAAFAGISLVVSSIMIGIITYVSVIERTKEIGIMRSLGARKKDISRIFNAETLLIGLGSGTLGILLYLGLQGPLNFIIGNFIDEKSFASLPLKYALGLIALSSILTLLAGFIPSRIAAKKDPVKALRTE